MSSPTKRMKLTHRTTCIDDLPPELLCMLFKYLHVKDLAACSLVNKRWYSIYSVFKVRRLVATDSLVSKWCGSDETIPVNEQCPPQTFCRLAEKPLLSNLRQLALCANEFKFDLNELNRFQQLVHLEIDIPFENKVNLKLPQLKILVFGYVNEHCALSIDCPLLRTLFYYAETEESLLEVKHPESIRKLETNLLGPKLAQFKNVECLVTSEFRAINKDTLHSLPALKELRYDKHIELVFNELFIVGGMPDEVKQTLKEFRHEAKLRGNDFRFNFAGFQLTKVNVDQIDFGVSEPCKRVSNEYVYMKNYRLIEPGALPFIHRVDYHLLLSHVTGEFPRCFSQKFTGIRRVFVKKQVQDERQLLWFLKSLRSLRDLDLQGVRLSQEFYDQLPASAPSLDTLFLNDYYSENELRLNFDFIGHLTGLLYVHIVQPLSFESLSSLVRWLGKPAFASVSVLSQERLKKRCIGNEGEQFRIEKESNSTKWTVFKRDSLLFQSDKPDEIIQFVGEQRHSCN